MMRAREFINEAKAQGNVPPELTNSNQGMIRMRDTGGYDRFYHMNRLSMVLAMADGTNKKAIDGVDPASFAEKFNIAFPYTDIEHLMMFQAMATVPTDGKELVKRSRSEEAKDTNITSPVANWRKKSKKTVAEDGTSGGTTSAMVASVPGGKRKKGQKVNLLGFAVPEGTNDTTVIKRVKP